MNACEYVKDKSITSVYVDNVAAGREAVSYLLALGSPATSRSSPA